MSREKIDLINQTFSNWLVLEKVENRKDGKRQWLCECQCEKKTKRIIITHDLLSGRTKSCGCQTFNNRKWHKKERENLIGQKFNKLTVLRYDELKSEEKHRPYWICECDCDKKTIKSVLEYSLTNKETQSCGCLVGSKLAEFNKKTKSRDLTGLKFGKLTVFKQDTSYTGIGKKWLCKCDCGSEKIISVYTSNLTRGTTQSCGCLYGKQLKENKFNLSGEYGIGWTTNTNKEFYFDLEDYDKIKDYCWYEHHTGYIITARKRKHIPIHRIIMNVLDTDIEIDHIYHNKFDNRKEMLRLVDREQNVWNRNYKGVWWSNKKQKWVANITYKKKKIIKYFTNYEDALNQRKEWEKQYFGEYAYKKEGENIEN